MEHRRNPYFFQNPTQDPVVHFLRNQIGQKTPHVIKILRSFTHLTVEYAQVESIELVAFQVVLAAFNEFIHVEVARDPHDAHD